MNSQTKVRSLRIERGVNRPIPRPAFTMIQSIVSLKSDSRATPKTDDGELTSIAICAVPYSASVEGIVDPELSSATVVLGETQYRAFKAKLRSTKALNIIVHSVDDRVVEIEYQELQC